MVVQKPMGQLGGAADLNQVWLILTGLFPAAESSQKGRWGLVVRDGLTPIFSHWLAVSQGCSDDW